MKTLIDTLRQKKAAATTAAKNDEGGFSLVELIVVVAIIGILTIIAIPVFTSVQNNAAKKATESAVTNVVQVAAAATAQQGGSGVDAKTLGDAAVAQGYMTGAGAGASDKPGDRYKFTLNSSGTDDLLKIEALDKVDGTGVLETLTVNKDGQVTKTDGE